VPLKLQQRPVFSLWLNAQTTEVVMAQEADRAVPTRSEATNASEATGKPWWQWLLLHPTLPAALIGALIASTPQILQWMAARDLNVPVSELARVREQKRAWEDNRQCLVEIQQVSLPSPGNYTISLQSCRSGDILLALTPLHDPSSPRYEWIVTRNLLRQQASFSFVTTASAQAAPTQSPPIQVIDVRSQGRNVVRRLQLSNKTCIDEIVDTATGRRLSSQSAPCTRF
jgi:hypothetical protein